MNSTVWRRWNTVWDAWFNRGDSYNIPPDTADACFWILYGEGYTRWSRLTKVALVLLIVAWWFWPRAPLVQCTREHHNRNPCGEVLLDHDGELLYCASNGNEYRNPRIVRYSNELVEISGVQICKDDRRKKPPLKITRQISKYVRVCTHRNLCFDLDSHISRCIQRFFLFNETMSPVPPNCFVSDQYYGEPVSEDTGDDDD